MGVGGQVDRTGIAYQAGGVAASLNPAGLAKNAVKELAKAAINEVKGQAQAAAVNAVSEKAGVDLGVVADLASLKKSGKGTKAAENGGHSSGIAPEGTRLNRGMKEGPDGKPEVGPTARTLGARPGTDIPVSDGKVYPGTGGMSVAPSPSDLPAHRRPPEHGGTGKDPVWSIDANDLGPDLQHRPDAPGHGTVQPSRPMTNDKYQSALEQTRDKWKKE
jgi:1-acyl-sn-glycerol-3-phosphate acyltransferase